MSHKIGVFGVSLLAASSFVVPAASAQQKAKSAATGIEGSWGGAVQQLGSRKPYALNLTVTKAGGTTEYPDLKCEGRLTRVGSSGGYTFFIETITKGGVTQGGTCINGSITMLNVGDKLAWGWIGPDQGAVAAALSTLTRK
jgi:hypothetical protein